MKRRTLIVALLLGAATLPGQSSEPDDLAWMAGRWCLEDTGRTVEEYWMAPHGGTLLGLSRTLKGERTAEFEYMRIMRVDGVQTFIAQPGGIPPTSFPRTAGGADWVRFENPKHDFPKRVEYRRKGNALHAEVSGPGPDGKNLVLPFHYEACR
jgi:hypothetical protein